MSLHLFPQSECPTCDGLGYLSYIVDRATWGSIESDRIEEACPDCYFDAVPEEEPVEVIYEYLLTNRLIELQEVA